jgi:hypothetical protein
MQTELQIDPAREISRARHALGHAISALITLECQVVRDGEAALDGEVLSAARKLLVEATDRVDALETGH